MTDTHELTKAGFECRECGVLSITDAAAEFHFKMKHIAPPRADGWRTGDPPAPACYLVTIAGQEGHTHTDMFIFDRYSTWRSRYFKTPEVLAWMPLPAPYRP